MPDLYGRRTLGDQRPLPAMWWEDGPRDEDGCPECAGLTKHSLDCPVGPFWTKVDFSEGPHGCWIWVAAVSGGTGYGWFRGKGAHRAAYEIAVGPIPAGYDIDHLCCVRRCVNPAHLEAVTPAVNRQRVAERRGTCLRGHAWNEANTYIRPDNGTRQCRVCRRMTRSD